MTTLQDLMSYARIQMIDKPECCGSISDCVEDAIDNINNNDNEEESVEDAMTLIDNL